MSAGDNGTRAVPTYVAAEAETTPLPKVTVPETPPPSGSGKGLGDLPMRVVYKVILGVVAVVVVGVGASIVLINRDEPATRSVTATAPSPVNQVASAAIASTSPSPTVTPPPTTAMGAALSDPRVPALPVAAEKLAKLPGKAAPVRGLIKDRRSGVAFPRFAKLWKLAKASPFASRQVLPKVKGSAFHGLLVSCAVPIPVQESVRDTAFLAARWTLNHHPSGATITWTASYPLKVGKREGWMLGYKVNYTLKGKKRTSRAAVALVDIADDKPALVFITIPDTQKKRWRDINVVMSGIRVL